MTTSVDEVCNDILKNPKPLVFIDTCSILDVIRVLYRDSISNTNTKSALKVVDYSKQGKLGLVTAENVRQEFLKHIDETVSTAKREITKISKSVSSLLSFHSSTSEQVMPFSKLTTFQWQAKARHIAETLLAECIAVKREDDYILRARKRVEAGLAPAKKGKAEQSDCEIVESFFDLTSKLRQGGFNKQITFITANTNDFGKIGAPLPPLKEQFRKIRAEYTTDLGHALNLSGL